MYISGGDDGDIISGINKAEMRNHNCGGGGGRAAAARDRLCNGEGTGVSLLQLRDVRIAGPHPGFALLRRHAQPQQPG